MANSHTYWLGATDRVKEGVWLNIDQTALNTSILRQSFDNTTFDSMFTLYTELVYEFCIQSIIRVYEFCIQSSIRVIL